MPASRLPDAVYFDSSVLIAAGPHLEAQSLAELRAAQEHSGIRLIIPALVAEEWVFHMRDQYRAAEQTLRRELGYLEPALVHEADAFRFKAVTEQDHDFDAYIDLIENAGFEIITTIEKLSLRDLLADAVRHVAPFGEKDTGFRDTIILETIADHASSAFTDPDILVVTRDAGMKRGINRLLRSKMQAQILFPEDAVREIESRKNEFLSDILQHGEPAARRFLEDHKEAIFAAVLSADTSLPRWGLMLKPEESFGLSGGANIRRINSVKPVEIKRPIPRLSRSLYENEESGRTGISFSVVVELNVTVSHSVTSPPRTVRLGQPVDLTTNWMSFVSPSESDIVIVRDILVEASAIRTDGPAPTYSDLRIERVYGLESGLLGLFQAGCH
ncbi:MAG: PIN domain-containing protein [Planctomycetota bacterium]